MIGVFDYTVWLTYLSLVSATLGIVISLQETGHPYIGIFFLLLCGLCDAFDGKVARTKKNRTDFQKKYGVQIDSLSDLVAFGVLPACIGNAMIRVCPTISEVPRLHKEGHIAFPGVLILYAIMILYVLAAMIRLAYFNVTEEERQKTESGGRKYFTGLPVTSAALIFPTVLLFQYLIPKDITLVYFGVMLVTTFLFVSKLQVKKPGLRGILIMVGIGVLEFIVLAFTLGRR
ncbi:MAG: CDP-alcohol phosphatidyltransferase family protein [Acetatifactor sp.]|nr:CDP-alcohol phosphatidyltransferase family protein [Acetatifactor sp.]